MESKKINQLATELAPALSDLTIIGDPTTGISKKITLSQMASLFTGTVEEYANVAAFPLVGVADTIYIALDTNVLYRWNTGTNAYVELSPNIINSLVFNDANGFDGTIALVGSVATLTITTALTTGSVGFIGASGALVQDNANFFWDDTNNRLGIGTNVPTTAIDAFGSGIIGRLNGTSTNNAFLGFASAGSNKWSIGNVQSDHRFRIYNEATTSELVSVLSTGEFGIGIANPTTKLHIDSGASALIANLDANVSVAKSISFRSDNSNRFNIEVSGTESGSDAGANFFIRRYSDAGALIDTPLTITRSTGNSTFLNNVGIGIAPTVTSGITELAIGSSATNPRISGIRDGVNAFVISSASTSTDIYERRNLNLRLGTNNLPRITISNGGEVGINTETPLSLLDVCVLSGGARRLLVNYADSIVTIKSANESNTGENLRIVGDNITFNSSSSGNGIERFKIATGGGVEVRSGNILSVYRTDNTRAIQLYTTINECVLDSWIPSSEPLHIRSNGTGGRIEFYTAGGEKMRITNGQEIVRGPIREFASSVSPPSPYTADLRLTITHNGWGGNADSGTVYVEYQGRAYGNNQTTTAFGVITYRLSDNGVSVTNVSTAGVTVSSVTISTDVSSNYILRITFGVAQSVDRASIFARTTNSFVSLISVDTV